MTQQLTMSHQEAEIYDSFGFELDNPDDSFDDSLEGYEYVISLNKTYFRDRFDVLHEVQNADFPSPPLPPAACPTSGSFPTMFL